MSGRRILLLTMLIIVAAALWWPRTDHHVHAQMLEPLAPPNQATHRSIGSGDWASASTWEGQQIPTSGSRVVIPAGSTVTVDSEVTEAPFWVRVDGTLRFAPAVHATLMAESLYVMPGGKLEMGTQGSPVTASAKLRITATGGQPIDHEYDPLELSRGVVVMPGGRFEAHGQPKTAFVTVSTLPAVGSPTLVVDAAPGGWQVGDQIVLTASTYDQDELFTITSISGTKIGLSADIVHPRSFPAKCEGCKLHVANLTRNVQVRSDAQNAGNPKLQGHVMLMGGGHQVRYAGFYHLGRTTTEPVTDPILLPDGTRDPSLAPNCGLTEENVRGRYALHFHNPIALGHAGPFASQSVAEGNVVTVQRNRGFKLGFVSHESNVAFRRNVGYQIDGSTFFTEEGNEVGEFVGNLAIYSNGEENGGLDHDLSVPCMKNKYPELFARRRMNVGFRGYGFWVHSGGMAMEGNVSAEAENVGFSLWSRGLDFRLTDRSGDNSTYVVTFPTALLPGGGSWATGESDIENTAVPATWIDNVAYAPNLGLKSGLKAAFEIKYHGIHQHEKFPNSPLSLHRGALGWNVMKGIATGYAGWAHIIDGRFIRQEGVVHSGGGGIGLGLANQGGNHFTVTDTELIGFNQCVKPGKESVFLNVLCDGVPYGPGELGANAEEEDSRGEEEEEDSTDEDRGDSGGNGVPGNRGGQQPGPRP